MKDKNDGAVIGCLVYLGMAPVLAALNGYALSMLWQWFIVSTFEMRPLGVLPAIGIAMVVRYLTWQDQPSDKSKTVVEAVSMWIALSILNPVMALFFGYIVHSFM